MKRNLIFNFLAFVAILMVDVCPTFAAADSTATKYSKIVNGKNIEKKSSFINLYKDGKDFYLEIPKSVQGREVIMSNKITDCSAPEVNIGCEVSDNPTYVIELTDSLVLFRIPSKRVIVKDESQNISRALAKSATGAVAIAIPIHCWNEDSTAVVVKGDKVFDLSSKQIVNLKGLEFGSLSVSGSSFQSESLRYSSICSDKENLIINYSADYELSLETQLIVYELDEKPVIPFSFALTMSLLPEKEAKLHKYDSRVGTHSVPFASYDSRSGSKTEYASARYDFSRGMKVYVDTLMPPTWQKAVKEGIEEWNVALKEAGVGPVEVLSYPRNDTTFFSSNPRVCRVTYAGQGTTLSYSMLLDPRNAEILGFGINVPKNLVAGVRRSAVYSISDVDPRYQEYFLSDDAVTDVLRASALKVFGYCLGLKSNYAASYSYTPDQLRDATFTAENGLSSSVTDDVLFNTFAVPGDKEKGLTWIVNKVGEYDKYAIKVLYDKSLDNETDLRKFIDSKNDQPEYFYATSTTFSPDPRTAATGLGNDNIATVEADFAHLKYVAANADKWLEDDSIPVESYVELFIDWIWLRFIADAKLLSSNVGAVMVNDVVPGIESPKYSTLPKDVQQKSIKMIFDAFRNIDWLEQNKRLLQMSGADRDVRSLTVTSLGDGSLIYKRLGFVMNAEQNAGSEYSSKEFMDDLRNGVMENLLKGNFDSPGEDNLIRSYLFFLITQSQVMTQNYKAAFSSSAFAESGFSSEESFRLPPRAVPNEVGDEMELLCRASLKDAIKDLKKGASKSGNDFTKRRIEFLVKIAESALGN